MTYRELEAVFNFLIGLIALPLAIVYLIFLRAKNMGERLS